MLTFLGADTFQAGGAQTTNVFLTGYFGGSWPEDDVTAIRACQQRTAWAVVGGLDFTQLHTAIWIAVPSNLPGAV